LLLLLLLSAVCCVFVVSLALLVCVSVSLRLCSVVCSACLRCAGCAVGTLVLWGAGCRRRCRPCRRLVAVVMVITCWPLVLFVVVVVVVVVAARRVVRFVVPCCRRLRLVSVSVAVVVSAVFRRRCRCRRRSSRVVSSPPPLSPLSSCHCRNRHRRAPRWGAAVAAARWRRCRRCPSVSPPL
jgi:hypothetical protein